MPRSQLFEVDGVNPPRRISKLSSRYRRSVAALKKNNMPQHVGRLPSGRATVNSLTAKSCYGGEKKLDSYFQVGTYRVAGTIDECVCHLKNQPNHPKSQKRVHLPILYT